ncbi:hypothetical protein PM082_005965 [Marasmius tenuissimus]|nr:hypothetical protein PM082_005965 [Marasmius tenuissimus]
MSSNEEGDGLQGRKGRVQRACDTCRRKKSANPREGERLWAHSWVGDGNGMPGNRCSSCVAYDLECSYLEAVKVRP